MEPVPETLQALAALGRYDDDRLGAELAETARRVHDLAPDVLGFSLGLVAQGVTLTYVATAQEVALLDAVQYLDGGPCVEAAADARVVEVDHAEMLDEGRWQLFAQVGAAEGIRSTLSLPVLDGDTVIGGVNLYGRLPDTFEGRAHDLAELFGAWAPGAIANADLGFTTRLEAAKAPARLEQMHTIDLAVGILVAARGVSPDQAETNLEEAAARAGIEMVTLAQAVIREHLGDHAAGHGGSGPVE